MSYIHPKNLVTIILSGDCQIAERDHAWLLEKRYAHEKCGRFHLALTSKAKSEQEIING